MKRKVTIDTSAHEPRTERSDKPAPEDLRESADYGIENARRQDAIRNPEMDPSVAIDDTLKPVEWIQAKKRIVKSRNLRVSTRPNLGTLLSDAYAVVASEMRAMRDQTAQGGELDREQAKKFSLLGDTCVRLMREEREQALLHDPAEMDDTQLLEAVAEAKKLLGGESDDRQGNDQGTPEGTAGARVREYAAPGEDE
jgi:hypothetical protein